jgi:oligoribonuclease NrnB/cAMP/cGMP phosphodiesterase (DHH superfamily)
MPDKWETYEKLLDGDEIEKVIMQGKYYREYQEIIIRDLIKHTFFYLQDINSKPYVVGYIESNVFISDIGNAMMKEFPQLDFAVVYHHEGNYTKFSLRSLDNKADVSTVAKIFGGGGHRNAAGCSVYGITNILPFAVIINNPEPNLLITTYEPGISFRWWMKTLLPRFISRKLVGY